MKISNTIAIVTISVFILSCNRSTEEKAMDIPSADRVEKSPAFNELTTSKLEESYAGNGIEGKRKFIRTADLKFKVKNVTESTNTIEDITKRFGGFVTSTELRSEIDKVTNTAVSEDSSLETTYFSVLSSISLRVPDVKLDSVLKEISGQVEYLDHRTIRADDVSLQMLANDLTRIRSSKDLETESDISYYDKPKVKDKIALRQYLNGSRANIDEARLANLFLKDRVSFSTIILSIYQKQALNRELISNNKNIKEYEPGFGSKLVESFNFGWEIIKSFLLAIMKIWGLLVLAIIIFIVHRTFSGKTQKSRV